MTLQRRPSAQSEHRGDGGKDDLPGSEREDRHVRLQSQTRRRLEREPAGPIVQGSDTGS